MEKVIISAFEFIMVLHPNENSPFGFTFEKIVFNPAELLYRSDELSAQEKDAEGTTPVPRGAFYDGTGIQQLDFADDGTVRYSPKGAPRTYTYVIDPAGRLIINDEGGATEARYLAEEDVIWYYGQYYYRE